MKKSINIKQLLLNEFTCILLAIFFTILSSPALFLPFTEFIFNMDFYNDYWLFVFSRIDSTLLNIHSCLVFGYFPFHHWYGKHYKIFLFFDVPLLISLTIYNNVFRFYVSESIFVFILYGFVITFSIFHSVWLGYRVKNYITTLYIFSAILLTMIWLLLTDYLVAPWFISTTDDFEKVIIRLLNPINFSICMSLIRINIKRLPLTLTNTVTEQEIKSINIDDNSQYNKKDPLEIENDNKSNLLDQHQNSKPSNDNDENDSESLFKTKKVISLKSPINTISDYPSSSSNQSDTSTSPPPVSQKQYHSPIFLFGVLILSSSWGKFFTFSLESYEALFIGCIILHFSDVIVFLLAWNKWKLTKLYTQAPFLSYFDFFFTSHSNVRFYGICFNFSRLSDYICLLYVYFLLLTDTLIIKSNPDITYITISFFIQFIFEFISHILCNYLAKTNDIIVDEWKDFFKDFKYILYMFSITPLWFMGRRLLYMNHGTTFLNVNKEP